MDRIGSVVKVKKQGFTLLELSIVLAIIGVIASGAVVLLGASLKSSQANQTLARMDAIEKALLNFGTAFSRMPCPADLRITAGSTNYGVEAASNGATCYGGTPSATSKWSNNSVEGAVPVRALKLPDSYMYDAWGHRFRYAVDPYYTTSGTLPVPSGHCTVASTSGLTVKDGSGASRTTAALYVLMSHGQKGHGAYTATSGTTMLNAGSTNTDEQANCHCTSSAAASGTTASYVEKAPTLVTAGDARTSFDDIVTFKEPWQIQSTSVPLATAAQCVYVADTYNNRVEIFDTSGNFINGIGAGYNGVSGAIGSSGTGNSQFNQPLGLTLDSSGNIWVVDSLNTRIQEFNSSGSFLFKFGTYGLGTGQIYGPYTIRFDTSGNIWLSEFGSYRIEEFNQAGTWLLTIGGQGATSNSACTNCGCTTSCGGVQGGTAQGQFNLPYGMTLDKLGNIWVGDYNNQRLQQFTPAGTWLQTVPLNPNNEYVIAMQTDAAGNIWMSSFGATMQKYSTAGTLLDTIGNGLHGNPGTYGYGACTFGQINQIAQMTFDASGNIWASDQGCNKVVEYNSAGSFIKQFGSTGTANGQFNATYSPVGIALSPLR